jgi:zinc D-Ala-D-Ala carboxypeptidase
MIWTYLLIKSANLIQKILNIKSKIKKMLKWIKDLLQKLRELRFIQYIPKDLELKYFKLSEFDSPDEVGSGKKMDSKFLEKLDYARHNAEIPFKINSGYRTQEWNMKVGGRFGSSHKKGLAVDIGYEGSRDRYLILNALMEVGITRFGIAKGFIHCDVDKSKDPDVIWLY